MLRTGIAAAALLIAPIAAQAADLPQPGYKAPAYTAPSYANWNGFYAGFNIGYGFGKSNWTSPLATTGDFNVTGMLAGLTLGYNFQTGTWVWGLEGDIDYSTIKGSTTTNCLGNPSSDRAGSWGRPGRPSDDTRPRRPPDRPTGASDGPATRIPQQACEAL